jgi:hypothetical protein
MGVFTQSGGFEVARTEERMEELRRGCQLRAWGITPSWSPRAVVEGAVFSTRHDRRRVLDPVGGVVDSLPRGTIMRERARSWTH